MVGTAPWLANSAISMAEGSEAAPSVGGEKMYQITKSKLEGIERAIRQTVRAECMAAAAGDQ